MTVAITDVVLRDAHQSLFATRLRLDAICSPSPLSWTTSATARWSAGAAPPLTPASAFSARTRGVPPARAEKGDAEDPAADAAPRPEPASATATTPTTWWSASWSAPSKTAWTSSASLMP